MENTAGYWHMAGDELCRELALIKRRQLQESADETPNLSTTSKDTQLLGCDDAERGDLWGAVVCRTGTDCRDCSKTSDVQCALKGEPSDTVDTDSSQALSLYCHQDTERMHSYNTETTDRSTMHVHSAVQNSTHIPDRNTSSSNVVQWLTSNMNDGGACMTFAQTPHVGCVCDSAQQTNSHYNNNYYYNNCHSFAYMQSPVTEQGLKRVMAIFYSLVHHKHHYNPNNIVKYFLAYYRADIVAVDPDEVLFQANSLVTRVYGCLALNALVCVWKTESVVAMVSEFSDNTILHLIHDSSESRSVLEKIFSLHQNDEFQRIVLPLSASCFEMALSRDGYLLIMAVIRRSMPDQKNHIVNSLVPFVTQLAVDKYGNHIAQEILLSLQCLHAETAHKVLGLSPALWMPLSCDAHGSYFMQTYVSVLNKAMRRDFVEAVLLEPVNLTKMLKDKYCNFVLQALIQACECADELQSIYTTIQSGLHLSPYSCSIDKKLQAQYFKLILSTQN